MLNDDRDALPRRVLVRLVRRVRFRHDVLPTVPLERSIRRVLAADDEGAAGPEIGRHERQRPRQIDAPTHTVNREYEIEVVDRQARVDLHWRLDQLTE